MTSSFDHPGFGPHNHRTKPESLPATVLCCPIRGQAVTTTMECLASNVPATALDLCWLDPDTPSQMKYGMRDAIRVRWTGEQDLIHIDHDMLFTWDHLVSLVTCESPYCTCPSWSFGTLVNATLAFAKFSAELQRRVDFNSVCMAADVCEGCDGDWWGLEYHLAEALKLVVTEPCIHNQVLNDHSMLSLSTKPAVSAVDLDTEEGRDQIRKFLRDHGWLVGHPAPKPGTVPRFDT